MAALIAIFLTFIAIAVLASTLCDTIDKNHRKRKAELKAEQKRLQQAATQERDEAVRAHQAELQRLEQASRSQAEAEAKRIVEQAMALSTDLKTALDPTKDFAAVDQMLRGVMMTRLVRGKYLTMKYMASPAGRVGLEWVVAGDPRIEDAHVALFVTDDLREKKTLLMQDVGPSNRWGDHVGHGVHRRYILSLRNQHDRELDRTELLVYMPTTREWNNAWEPAVMPAAPPPPPPEPAAEPVDPAVELEREIKASLAPALIARKVKAELHQQIDQDEFLDEDQKEDEKAVIDSVIVKVREKHGA